MIYDYYQVEEFLDKLKDSNFVEQKPIAYTSIANLPVRHFTLGNGKNHVVVTSCQHANEVIGASFIVSLMKHLKDNDIAFEGLTIHFIPILNPEGYIVNTSAIKKRTEGMLNPTDFYSLYHKLYQKDDASLEHIKMHQELFKDIKADTCISDDFLSLKKNVSNILGIYPQGSIINWASNGRGVDLNSNSQNCIVLPWQLNRKKAYSNIRIDIPGPIGYPGKTKDKNFKEEKEVIGLKELLKELNTYPNYLLAFLNYHSTGGLIYQAPEIDTTNFITIYNYLLSKLYQDRAREIIKKGILSLKKDYRIIKNKSGIITSVNDELRTKFVGNLLIELSTLCSNPLGPFSNCKNYATTISSNIAAFINVINNLLEYGEQAELIHSRYNPEEDIYHYVDIEYKRIKRKNSRN